MIGEMVGGNSKVAMVFVVLGIATVIILGLFAMHWLIGGIFLGIGAYMAMKYQGDPTSKLAIIGIPMIIGVLIIVFGKGWF